jgi:hypothetical protein
VHCAIFRFPCSLWSTVPNIDELTATNELVAVNYIVYTNFFSTSSF